MRFYRVTDVLPYNAEKIAPDVLAYAAHRGQQVHKATHIMDTGSLDWSDLDEELRRYCLRWQEFKDLTGWFTEASEFEITNAQYNFVGHPDRRGWFTKLKQRFNYPKRVILDIKTGDIINPTTGPQTAAYDNRGGGLRCSVNLTPDKPARLTWWHAKSDWMVFLTYLRNARDQETIAQWETEKGLR